MSSSTKTRYVKQTSVTYDKGSKKQKVTNATPPAFAKLPSTAHFIEGGTARFDCQVCGNPMPEVVWTRHGTAIQDDLRHKVIYNPQTGESSLIISNLTMDDDGEYNCTAVNSAGEASLTVSLAKQPQPQYYTQIQDHQMRDVTNTAGQPQYYGAVQQSRSLTKIVQEKVHQEGPTYYSGCNESFRVDTFEYRLLREEDFRQSIIRMYIEMVKVEQVEQEVITGKPLSAPQVLQKPRNSKLLEGSDVTFQARISGNPPPRIYWFKDGQPLVHSQRVKITFSQGIVTLHIHMALPEDAGYYTLLAENRNGRVASSCHLVIESINTNEKFTTKIESLQIETAENLENRDLSANYSNGVQESKALGPHFTRIPSDKEAPEGKMVRFECTVRGRPVPDVIWYLNGTQVVDDTTHKILVNEGGVHSLMITHVGTSDAGTYTCLARNKNGEDRFHVQLSVVEKQVLVAPKFVERFKTVHLREGDQLILHCRAIGTPTPRLTWQKDGSQVYSRPPNVVIEGSEATSTLYINNATSKDAGWYQCNAQNQAGTASTRGRIHVEAESVPNVEKRYLNFQKATRIIEPEPEPAAETVYLKHIERPAPSRRRDSDSEYHATRPAFTTHLRDLNVNESERAHFDARLIPIGDPNLKVEWFHNERPLQASSRVMTTFNFGYVTLTLLHVEQEDEGVYVCRAYNEIGDVSTTATLRVHVKPTVERSSQHPESLETIRHLDEHIRYQRHESIDDGPSSSSPVFTKPLSNLDDLTESGFAHFEAQISPVSDPTMRIEWYFNGKPLSVGSRISTVYSFGYVALNIAYLRLEDSGVYMCRAVNSKGEAISTATLRVRNMEGLVTTDSGIEEQQMFIRKTQELEEHQKRQYVSQTTEDIVPNQPPRFIRKLVDQVNIQEHRTAHFEATLEPQGDSTMKVDWFKDGQPLEASSRINTFSNFGYAALTIQKVEPRDAGVYTVVATNSRGRDDSSARLTVRTKQSIVTEVQYEEGWEKIQHLEDSSRYRRREEEDIQVKQKPVFTSPLSGPESAPEGNSAHFETRVEPLSDPEMKVEWFFNGQPLTTGHRFKTYFDFGYVALDILYLFPEDSGVFTVRAVNKLGEAILSKKMLVQSRSSIDTSTLHEKGMQQIKYLEREHRETEYIVDEYSRVKPYFVQPLKNPGKVFSESETVHFEARIEPINDPSLTVAWFFNGKPLKTGHRFKTTFDFGFISLDILDLFQSDSGEYTVRVTNQLGSAHSSVSIQVSGREKVVTEAQFPDGLDQIRHLEEQNRYKRAEFIESAVDKPPTFLKSLKNVETVEATNVHLEARLAPSGDPSMKVEWFRNGVAIPIGHRFRPLYDFDFVALDLLQCYAEDSGVYTCKAKNNLGEAATSCNVVIHSRGSNVIREPQHPDAYQQIQHLEDHSRYRKAEEMDEYVAKRPRFLTKLKDVTIREGAVAHFECRIEPANDPKLKVDWFHNGKEMMVGNRYQPFQDFGFVALNILKCVEEDSGIYTCRISNELGSEEMTVNLAVSARATIQRQSTNPESYRQIQQLEDMSRYQREVEEDEEVRAAPVFTLAPRSQEMGEREKARFECHLTPVGDPNMKVEWYKDDQPLMQGSRFLHIFDFGYIVLEIMDVVPEDSGHYYCKAVNNFGEAVTSATLKVHGKQSLITEPQVPESYQAIRQLESYKPRRVEPEEPVTSQAPVFTSAMKNLELKENGTAHFECRLIPVGDPTLVVEWLHNGMPLLLGSRVRTIHDFGHVGLDLSRAMPEDSGTFTCKATNVLGQAQCSATLKVSSTSSILRESQFPEGLQKIVQLESQQKFVREEIQERSTTQKPFFVTPLKGPTDLHEGQHAHYECRIEPFPDSTMKVEWFRNGRSIQLGHRFRTMNDFGFAALDVLTLMPEDSGEYTVRATNHLGTASSSISLKVHDRASVILEPQQPDSIPKIRALEDQSRYRRAEVSEKEILEKPNFGRPLYNLDDLKEGQAAHLETILTPVNDPTMKVEWFVNGRSIPTGSRFKTMHDFGFVALDIANVVPEDSGLYMCKATNKNGEAVVTCSIRVSGSSNVATDTMHEESLAQIHRLESQHVKPVETPQIPIQRPVFTVPLKSAENVIESQSVHLEGRLEPINDTKLSVEWFINGVPLKMGHRFRTIHDFGYVALDILYAYPEDSGTYMCKAVNELGEAVTSAVINVKANKSIYSDTYHPEGFQKIQQLEAQSLPTRAEIEDRPVTKPVFVSELQGVQEYGEGQSAHFEGRVEPAHDANLRIEIYHNGRPLVAGSRYHVTFDFGYIALDIGKLVPEDSGTYTVRAINELGEAKSSISIRVGGISPILSDSMHQAALPKIQQLENPYIPEKVEQVQTSQRPVFTMPLQNIEQVPEGGSAHLECRLIPVGDPNLKVEWYHNSESLKTGSRFKTVQNFGYVALDIMYLTPEDSGVYMCKATNLLGEGITSCTVKVKGKSSIEMDTQHPEGLQKIRELEHANRKVEPLVVEKIFERPVFTTPLIGPEIIMEEQSAHLECRVVPVGDPNLTIHWFVNGVELKAGSRFVVTNDFGYVALDIKKAIAEDSGVYMCKAVNKAGEAVTSTSIKVKAKSSVLLESFHPEAHRKIQDMEMEASKIPAQIESTPKRTPVFVKQLNSHEMLVEGQSVHVGGSLEPIDDEKLVIKWYKNGRPLLEANRIITRFDFGLVSLDIIGVRPDDSGIYTCRAVNEVGEAVSTCTIKVEGRESLLLGTEHPESLQKIRQLESYQPVKQESVEPEFTAPVFVTLLNNVELLEAETAHFECRVEPSRDATLKIEVLRNNKSLPSGSRFSVNNDFGFITLDISSCYAEDSALYTVRATNSKGQAVTTGSLKVHPKSSIIMTPQHPMGEEAIEKIQALEARAGYLPPIVPDVAYPKPYFVNPLQNNFTVQEGKSVHLECRVEPSGDPNLTTEWFVNGVQIEMGSRFKFMYDFGYVVLDIADAQGRDNGIWTCKARNLQGEAFTTTTMLVLTVDERVLERTLHPEGQRGLEEIQKLEEWLRRKEPTIQPQEGRPPTFITQFSSLVNMSEGDSAHFEAKLEPIGDQTMKVEWFHNGKLLSVGHRIRTYYAFGFVLLEITDLRHEDAGEYVCQATNKWGKTSQSMTLEIIDKEQGEKPKFTKHLQSIGNLKEGQSAHFECFLTPVGDPYMFVKWYHNRQELRESSRIKTISDFGYVLMDISFVHEEDSGEYVCVATNKYGSDITRCTLQVAGPGPNVIRTPLQPQSLQRIAELEGSTKYQKTYQRVDSTISQAPKFITQIETIGNIVEGQSAHFEAQITPPNDPYLKVEWLHNGKILPSGHRFRAFHDFGIVILDILDCVAADSGEYICRATNKLGSDVTRATLSIRAKSSIIYEPQVPAEMASNERIIEIEEMRSRKKTAIESDIRPQVPVFTKQLESPPVLKEGENIHLEAKLIPTNDPDLRVEWFKNGVSLRTATRIRTIHDFGFVVLEISPVYPDDSGVYTCRAKNKYGEAVTTCTIKVEGKRSIILESQLPDEMAGGIEKIAQIEEMASNKVSAQIADKEVAQAPQFLSQPKDQELPENAMAHFECKVAPTTDPTMRIEWYLNGRLLVAGSRVRTISDFGFVILEIAGVYSRDSGVYTCEATNKYGKASVSCKLTVRSNQSVIVGPQLPPEFLTGCESIQRLEESLWKTPEVVYDKEIRQPPKFVTQIKELVEKSESESAHFECRLEPVGDPNLKVEWFHNGVSLKTGSRVRTVNDFGFVVLEIDWLYARDTGEYVCKATNKYGVDVTKGVLKVKSKRDVILEPQLPPEFSVHRLRELDMPHTREVIEEDTKVQAPRFVTQIQSLESLIEGDSAHFECKLLPVNDPNLRVEWYLNGKPLISGHRFKTTHDFGFVALDILYVYPEDSGEYVARAVNKIGEDTTKAIIRCRAKQKIIYNPQLPKEMESGVQKIAQLEASRQRIESFEGPMQERQAPMFVMKPEPLTVLEGEWAKFCCRVVGFPRPKVFWVLNGNTVINGTRYKLSYDGIYHLDIPRTRQYDQGKIEVFARNILGEAHCSTSIQVRPRHDDYRAVLKNSPRPWYDQEISKYQKDRHDTELEKVFEEKLTPGGTEKEVWKTAESVDEERYKIREHQTDDKAPGQPKKYATDIKFVERKSLEQKPENKSNVAVMAKSYQTHVEGQYRDPSESAVHAKEILTKQQRQTQREVQGDLEITRKIRTTETLAQEHSGVTKERRVIGPPMKTKPPVFTKKLQPARVYEGERATFECHFDGEPVPTISWFRENFEIQNSRDFKIETKGNKSSLTIREVYLEDSGVFSVKIENPGGSAKSSSNLVVEERKDYKSGAVPPSFAKTIESINVKSGELARFDALVVGSKPIDVYWLKNGTKVMPDVAHKMIEDDDASTLLILEALPDDSGLYECVAINQVGEARCQAQLNVEGSRPVSTPTTPTTPIPIKVGKERAPNLIEPLKDTVVAEGGSAIFKCKIQGVSASQITWYKGDSVIKQSRYFRMGNERDIFTLRISEAFPEDEGVYKCIAMNSLGSVTTKAKLQVTVPQSSASPPSLSPLQSVIVALGSPARFVASLSGSPTPKVSWFRNGQMIQQGRDFQMFQDNASCSLVIRQTYAEDEGLYLCRATNDLGEVESSANLKLET